MFAGISFSKESNLIDIATFKNFMVLILLMTYSFNISHPVVGKGFVHREELYIILNSLKKPSFPSFNLYGPERSGKSSLLRHLCEVAGPELYPHYLWCYVDMQGILSPEDFRETVFEILSQNYTELGNVPTVLGLDEFDAIFGSRFTTDFYDRLLILADRDNISLVAATHRPLRNIAPYGYEKFTPLELGPISEEDALLLLTSRGLNEEESRWVIETVKKVGLFPFYLQALGFCLDDAKRKNLPPEETREMALNYYREQFSWAQPL